MRCQPPSEITAGRVTPGPRLSSPGAMAFKTQPDALWAAFNGRLSCDLVAIEVCTSIQNLNDKRSRYFPSSHSLVLTASTKWLLEVIPVGKKQIPRYKAFGSLLKPNKANHFSVPVRHLRVLYALPDVQYQPWIKENANAGHEYFCAHSALDGFESVEMQGFLKQMSRTSHFFNAP
jgi:hypothetical protein